MRTATEDPDDEQGDFADGGVVGPGRTVPVGDRGCEFIVGGPFGCSHPAPLQNITINIHTASSDPQAIAEAVRAALRRTNFRLPPGT